MQMARLIDDPPPVMTVAALGGTTVLEEPGIILLSGSGGSGKTWLLTELAMAVGAGVPARWGLTLPEGDVLMLVAEGSLADRQRKRQQILHALGAGYTVCMPPLSSEDDWTQREWPSNEPRYMDALQRGAGLVELGHFGGQVILSQVRGELQVHAIWEEVLAACDELNPTTLLLDSLTAAGGVNPLQADQVRSLMTLIEQRLCVERGITVVAAAHDSKARRWNRDGHAAEDAVSGSSSWVDLARVAVHVSDDDRLWDMLPRETGPRGGKGKILTPWPEGAEQQVRRETRRLSIAKSNVGGVAVNIKTIRARMTEDGQMGGFE